MATYDIIQHLSGGPVDWLAHDIVIPNGEWAFEEVIDGTRKGKVGNGIDTWSELPYAFIPPVNPGIYNDWNKLWEVICDGTQATYTFTEDSEGNPLLYSELYLEINCPAAAQSATTTIYFDESFLSYVVETLLPSTSQLVHAFHLHSQIERTSRAKGVPATIATLQFSRIFNNTSAPLEDFSFIHFFNDKNINYPSGSIIRIWGR